MNTPTGLSDEDMETVRRMFEVVVRTLRSGTGSAVLLADIEGDGHSCIIMAGNEGLAPMLLHAAAAVGEQMYGRPDGVGVQ